MVASAVLGYANVALNGNELGLIGSIVAGVCTIIAAMMTNSAASRRQKRELRYQRKGSGVTGLLLGLLLVSIAAIFYFASRSKSEDRVGDDPAPTLPTTTPTVEPTVLPTDLPTTTSDPPITLDDAAGFISSYLELGNHSATEAQAWAMFTDAHAADMTQNHGGPAGFHQFWDSVDTVTLTESPSLIGEPTASRAVVRMPLTYRMTPESGRHPCIFDNDDFTVVRVDGALRIDEATTDYSKEC